MRKFLLFTFLFFSVLIQAQWSSDPTVNDSVCTASNTQTLPQIVTDGSGGAIIVWEDRRNNSFGDIYAQRINSSGNLAWTTGGVPICLADYDQPDPQIISDGLGGAIIAWYDGRSNDTYDVYAQKINSSGVVQWTADGIAVCIEANDDQFNVRLISDGAGGAIITWQDYRNGNADIYAQRIDSNGNALWAANGVAVCTQAQDQNNPRITSDAIGGAIITWEDSRNFIDKDIYAQRIDSDGNTLWTTNGVIICAGASNDQLNPQITTDGSNGAIIVWEDYRSGIDIYAQLIDADGNVQWGLSGTAVCASSNDQLLPQIISDNSGGAIMTWEDYRNGVGNCDIFTQRLNSIGSGQWGSNGLGVCTQTGFQGEPQLTTDGSGGAIIVWRDLRADGFGDIYAQKIFSGGTVAWISQGIEVCTNSPSYQGQCQITNSGSSDAIICWVDERNGSFSNDIYASKVFSDGSLPVELSSFSAKVINKNVELNWKTETEVSNYGFEIERSAISIDTRNISWIKIGFVNGNGNSNSPKEYSFTDSNPIGGSKFQYRLKQIDNDGQYEYSNIIEISIFPETFKLSQNYPNPFNPATIISWQTPVDAYQTLKVYDVLGNEVATLVNEFKPAGTYEVEFNPVSVHRDLVSGIYFYQLKAGNPSAGSGQEFVETKKMILIR